MKGMKKYRVLKAYNKETIRTDLRPTCIELKERRAHNLEIMILDCWNIGGKYLMVLDKSARIVRMWMRKGAKKQ